MFETRAAARAALAAAFEPDFVKAAMRVLVPVIAIVPVRTPSPGGTRIGGTPDLPAGLDWPRPTSAADPEAIAGRGNAEAAAEMREHMGRGLPFAFLAQVDLAELAALDGSGPEVSRADLPGEGRLLFFYDLAVGPWEAGARVCRVIWDRSPRETLKEAPLPPNLAEAIRDWRRRLAQGYAEHGLAPPPPNAATVYAGRRRAAALRLRWQLPDPAMLADEDFPELPRGDPSAMPERERDLCFGYDEFRDEHGAHDGVHQLLGLPMPEQDDPRLDAASLALFGSQHPPRDGDPGQDDRLAAEARGWRLLLQLGIGDWMGDGEGTVYVLIRCADLARRDFGGAVAVYQQT